MDFSMCYLVAVNNKELKKLEVQSKGTYQSIASTELGMRTVQVINPPN